VFRVDLGVTGWLLWVGVIVLAGVGGFMVLVGFGYDASRRFLLIFGILGVVWSAGHEVLYGRPSVRPKNGIQKPVQIWAFSALPEFGRRFERGWCIIEGWWPCLVVSGGFGWLCLVGWRKHVG